MTDMLTEDSPEALRAEIKRQAEQLVELRATAVLVELADAGVRRGNYLYWHPSTALWRTHINGDCVLHDTLLEALGALGEDT